jgi:hypothetical protein
MRLPSTDESGIDRTSTSGRTAARERVRTLCEQTGHVTPTVGSTRVFSSFRWTLPARRAIRALDRWAVALPLSVMHPWPTSAPQSGHGIEVLSTLGVGLCEST